MNLVTGNTETITKTHRGWTVGHMHTGLAGTTAFEVKQWRYDDPIDYGWKKFLGTEYIVIYQGVLEIQLVLDGDKETVTLRGSCQDYVIFSPGVTKKVVVLETPAFGVTVRWPSSLGLNEVVKGS
ncbi:MAG TPA: hypothetical protein VJJ73_00100 [Candidatus Paceibacterota bacterium]